MARPVWECDDARDAPFERLFLVYGLDEVAEIKGGHLCIFYVVARPRRGRLDDALIVDRFVTNDVRALARSLVDLFSGTPVVLRDAAGQPDPDKGRNLLNRVDLYRRDADLEVVLAVHYGEQLRARERRPVPPTPAMIARVRGILADEGWAGHRWHSALSLEELPQPPHEPLVFALVGVDAKGRVNDALPRPSHHGLDRSFGRDVRSLVQAVVADQGFVETVKYAERHGLALVYLWRPARRIAA